jgi:hypothetical protein
MRYYDLQDYPYCRECGRHCLSDAYFNMTCPDCGPREGDEWRWMEMPQTTMPPERLERARDDYNGDT